MFDACTAYQLHIHHQYHLYCLKIHHWHHHNQHDQFYFQYYQNWNVWRLLQKCKLRQHSNADRFCMFHKTFLHSRFFTNVFGEKIAKASRTCLLLKKTFIYFGSNGVNSYVEYLTLPLFFWRGAGSSWASSSGIRLFLEVLFFRTWFIQNFPQQHA